MKALLFSTSKFIGFFLGWAILVSILPIPKTDNPALWRLWAEMVPLFGIAGFTLLFWLAEKRTTKLHLVDNPIKGAAVGAAAGVVWLGSTLVIMLVMNIIEFKGYNQISEFAVWMLAAFFNVVMQELLVRGYLYQMLKQTYNVFTAAHTTTILFVLLHGGAFEAGVIPVMNVLTMSFLMTIVLEYTGSIIAPTIMHFLWNGVGSLVLGGVSLADDYPHLLKIHFFGNPVLSGGACKMEGSIIVLVINAALILMFSFLRSKHADDEINEGLLC